MYSCSVLYPVDRFYMIFFFYIKLVILPLSRPNNNPRDRHVNRTRERSNIAPTPAIGAVTPHATWHKHITRNEPLRKGLYTRKARGRRALALEQQLHLLLHRGHNNATRPVMHQTRTPPYWVRDTVAHPSNESLGTFTQTSHYIHPKSEEDDILVCTRRRVVGMLLVLNCREKVFDALACM